jgi:hypothetical protein
MIITLQEYKTHESITKTDMDARLTLLVEAACNLIKAEIGSKLIDDDPIIEYLEIDYDTNKIFPEYSPIIEVISVEEQDTDTLQYVITDETTYSVSEISISKINGYWVRDPYVVKITYKGGYSSIEAPSDLKLATIELVNYYHNKGFLPSRTMQGATVVNSDNGDPVLPSYIRAMIEHYKD